MRKKNFAYVLASLPSRIKKKRNAENNTKNKVKFKILSREYKKITPLKYRINLHQSRELYINLFLCKMSQFIISNIFTEMVFL